ncbi:MULTISPECIES: hypothetical protein [Fructobacillus]
MILTIHFPFEQKQNLPKTSHPAKKILARNWQNEILTVGIFLMILTQTLFSFLAIFNACYKNNFDEMKRFSERINNQKQAKIILRITCQIVFSSDDLTVIWPTYLL